MKIKIGLLNSKDLRGRNSGTFRIQDLTESLFSEIFGPSPATTETPLREQTYRLKIETQIINLLSN